MKDQNVWVTIVVGAIIATLVLLNGNKIDSVRKEFVDHRPSISLELADAIANNPASEDDEEKTTLCDGSGYIVQGDGHRTKCPGCAACEGSGQVGDKLCDCNGDCKCEDCKCKNCDCPNCPSQEEIPKEIEDCPEWLEDLQGGRPESSEEKVVEKEQPKKNNEPQGVVEKDEYSPKWNIDGSFARAESREELLKHLSSGVYNYKLDGPGGLNSYSTDDLQRIHDQHHERMNTRSTTIIRTRSFDDCPGGVCPTNMGGGRLLRWWR